MKQSADQHSQSADALKAMAEGRREGGKGPSDAFVGPEEPQEPQEASDAPVEAMLAEARVLPPEALAPAAGLPPDPFARRRHAEEFDRRARRAHAHQYKTVMVPLLITMGAILVLMGAYVLLGDGGAGAPADAAPEETAPRGLAVPIQVWFPLLALPLGAILLAGAWWFHRDVTRKT
jgi:hypothetical protein